MTDFIENFFGAFGGGEYAAYIVFTLIGMGLIKLVRYRLKKSKALAETPPRRIRFNGATWLDDNLLDFIIAFICSFLMYRFFPDALHFITKFVPMDEFEEKMFYGLLLGLGFQFILHKLMNSFKITDLK